MECINDQLQHYWPPVHKVRQTVDQIHHWPMERHNAIGSHSERIDQAGEIAATLVNFNRSSSRVFFCVDSFSGIMEIKYNAFNVVIGQQVGKGSSIHR